MTNFVTNPGSGGATFASDTISSVEYPIAKSAWGSAGTATQTDVNNPLPIQMAGTNFFFSTANSSTSQLAAAATFTGTVESTLNEPNISVLLTADQNCTLTLTQYIDSGGTRIVSNQVFSVAAGVPFSRAYVANGNYFKASVTNNGGATTTTLNLNVAYGQLVPSAEGGFAAVQQDINIGRTSVVYWANAAAAGATTVETAISLTKSSGTSATSAAVSHVVPANKKLRIVAISVATRGNNTATAQTTTFNLRLNTAGAVTTTSTPIIFSARSATPATANAWDRFTIPLGEGYEISGNGTLQIGMTAAATFTTNAPTWDVQIIGYEY